jgi:hypothetical protein
MVVAYPVEDNAVITSGTKNLQILPRTVAPSVLIYWLGEIMSNLTEKQIVRGFRIERKDNGLWLCFESGGKKSSINVETKFAKTKIIKGTILDWAENQFAT